MSKTDVIAKLVCESEPVKLLYDLARAHALDLSRVYVVGGLIRDLLLEVDDLRDLDLAIEGDGHKFAKDLASASGGVIADEYKFGTATVVIPDDTYGDSLRVDIASCRSELYSKPGALPDVKLGESIEQDLLRRDITINAIAVSLGDNLSVIDPCDGIKDIEDRVVKLIHKESLLDDPTRIFRMARYAGRFNLNVSPDTYRLVSQAVTSDALLTISKDRIRAELELLLKENTIKGMLLLDKWGVLEAIKLTLDATGLSKFLATEVKNVWLMRLAILLSYKNIDVDQWLNEYGFSSCEHNKIIRFLLISEVLDEWVHNALSVSDVYIRIGELDNDEYLFAVTSVSGNKKLVADIDSYYSMVTNTVLSINGDDVLKAGVPAGKEVGNILRDIYLARIDKRIITSNDEAAMLKEFASKFKG